MQSGWASFPLNIGGECWRTLERCRERQGGAAGKPEPPKWCWERHVPVCLSSHQRKRHTDSYWWEKKRGKGFVVTELQRCRAALRIVFFLLIYMLLLWEAVCFSDVSICSPASGGGVCVCVHAIILKTRPLVFRWEGTNTATGCCLTS